LFEPLQSPSFRPDPQSLKAVARRASQEWPVALIVPTRRLNFQALLDWPSTTAGSGASGSLFAARRAFLKRSGSRGYTASARRISNSSRLRGPSC